MALEVSEASFLTQHSHRQMGSLLRPALASQVTVCAERILRAMLALEFGAEHLYMLMNFHRMPTYTLTYLHSLYWTLL